MISIYIWAVSLINFSSTIHKRIRLLNATGITCLLVGTNVCIVNVKPVSIIVLNRKFFQIIG